MASGLQVFSATGQVLIDTSTSIGTILGSFSTGGPYPSSGIITNSFLSQGTPFYYVVSIQPPTSGGYTFIGQVPVITFSGDTLTYTPVAGIPDTQTVINVLYGIY